MDIKLKSMSITNFKGIKSLLFDFSDETKIFGDNATGKTSVFDAFTWLLFGKDSLDRKDFNIKPLDVYGFNSDRVESEVSATLSASGVEMVLKRVFREKWQKKKGEEVAEFVGNETLYFWNDVPLQQKEYMSKIETIVDENIFKLITNPLYFNGLKWQDRRSVLLSIAGKISDIEVLDSIASASNEQEINSLTSVLNQGKTLAEHKKEISAKKKKASDELKLIPSRIDEINRSKPEAENYDAIRASIKRLTGEISAIDEQISNKVKANDERFKKIQEKQNELYSLKSKLSSLEHSALEIIRDRNRKQDDGPLKVRREITSLENQVVDLDSAINLKLDAIVKLESTLEPTREKWAEKNVEQLIFNEDDFHCPACKREYESSDIESTKESLLANFNSAKVKSLAQIQEIGLKTVAQITLHKEAIEKFEAEKADLASRLEELRAEFITLVSHKTNRLNEKVELSESLASNVDHASLSAHIKELQKEIEDSSEPATESDNDKGLKAQKATLMQQVGDLYTRLAGEEQGVKADKRIQELLDQERSLAQLIAEFDGVEFMIDSFNKAKMNIMESRINSKFRLASFRMFKTLVNGGEEETCETMFRASPGKALVPWSDLNAAAKIQVGIDIINALSEFYSVTAPIWIDNRESTVRIPETESQVVNLIVKEGSALVVQSEQYQYEAA